MKLLCDLLILSSSSFYGRKKFNNKRAYEKIKRKVLFNGYKDGGLRMVDVRRFQDSVLLDWAEKLISGKYEASSVVQHFFKDVGGLNVFKSKISPKDFINLGLIPSLFWSKTLQTWLQFADNKESEVRLMILFLITNILPLIESPFS